MDGKKVLTVVVPTYNAERYLRDNLESFIDEKNREDLEVLIINDGSTDRSLEIAEEYVQKYPSVFRIITKENGGHGSGINCGIQNACGTYFKVVDADDWVDKNAFSQLMNTLRKTDSDIVYSGFYWVYDDGRKNKSQFRKEAEFTEPFKGVEYNREYIFDKVADQLYIKMHNMTIRTEILVNANISIDEKCYYVDTEYILYPIPYVKTILFVNAYVYMYRIGNFGQSVSIEKMQKNEMNYNRVFFSLIEFYSKLGNEISCTEAKKIYIENLIARIVAGKIKIMLSFPASKGKKYELQQFDEELKSNYPQIYKRNINSAVKILRFTKYTSYYLACWLVRKKY